MTELNKENDKNIENTCDYHLFCTFEPKLPVLDVIHEKFVRLLRVSLSSFLKSVVTIETKTIKTMEFKNFIEGVNDSRHFSINKLDRLNGYNLFVLEKKLCSRMIDILFGASNKQTTKIFEGEYTPMQLSVLRKAMQVAVDDYNKAWSFVFPVDAKISRSEINPQFIGFVPEKTKVIVTTTTMTLGGVTGEFQFMIPYSTLFPARDKIFNS